MEETFLPRRGSFRQLKVYKIAEILYDITFYFAHTYLDKRDRTVDQMVQAARSGKQNIAEGNLAGSTSAEMEIKLTNVAKASLGELLLDYEDYLRVRGLSQWGSSHPRYGALRRYTQRAAFEQHFRELLPRLNHEEICNLAITLLYQIDFLLVGLIKHQESRFLAEGGVRERMSRARRAYRTQQNPNDCS